MSKQKTPKVRKPLSVWLRRWHRFIGMISAILIVIVAITGIMLNHTEGLSMADRLIRNKTLLKWYGLEISSEILAFRGGPPKSPVWFVQSGDALLQDGIEVTRIPGETLAGCVFFDNLNIIATDRRLHLLTKDGQLVESLGSETGLPSTPGAIGVTDNLLTIRPPNQRELQIWATLDLETWSDDQVVTPIWSKPEPPPKTLRPAIETAIIGDGLTLERIILDLHSGRIFGRFGHLVMDAAAICMLLLTITGVWLNYARPKKKKKTKSP